MRPCRVTRHVTSWHWLLCCVGRWWVVGSAWTGRDTAVDKGKGTLYMCAPCTSVFTSLGAQWSVCLCYVCSVGEQGVDPEQVVLGQVSRSWCVCMCVCIQGISTILQGKRRTVNHVTVILTNLAVYTWHAMVMTDHPDWSARRLHSQWFSVSLQDCGDSLCVPVYLCTCACVHVCTYESYTCN